MTIKEVEQQLEVPRATVRFYEKEGLINPGRGKNGYREYSNEDILRLKQIIIFRKLGMTITGIDEVLNGTKLLSEAVAENIVNLEKQMEELRGALSVCHRLQEKKEEMETFEVENYWNILEEEEKKGNHFLDIAKDMVHFEKTILFEYFGIADAEGNLAVSIPKAICAVIMCGVVYIVTKCILAGRWDVHSVLGGLQAMLFVIELELVVGIPIFLIGRKRPEILKKRNRIMFRIFLALFILCIVLLMIL